MGFRIDSCPMVWEVKPQNERWTKIRITISRMNTQTDAFETDFSGWADVYGTVAAAKAAKLKPKDRIRLKSIDLTNGFDREKQTFYWNPKIFDFELANDDNTGSKYSSGDRSSARGSNNRSNGNSKNYSGNSNSRNNNGNNSRSSSQNVRNSQAAYEGDDEDEGAELPF